ncbi:MAG TPA: hypothetical protein VKP03_03185 [Patescibacteria group bacterium]|nr:hypothetical protein [Patescibacteria group bacterium]
MDWRLMGATCVVRSPGRLISSLADPLRGGEFCFRSGHSGLQICGLSFRQMQYLGKRLEFLERSLGTFSQVNELYALQELWQKLMAQMSRDLAETKSATRSPIGEYVQDYLEELRLGILSTQSYRGWGKTKAQLGAEDKENIEHFLVYDLAKILPRLPVYEKAYVAKKKERGRPLTKPDLEEAGKEAEKETPKETKEEKEQE